MDPRTNWNDYTATFRQLGTPARDERDDSVESYSYDRPAYIFWNAFVNGLIASGLTEAEAIEWVQSKKARWMLDGELSDVIEGIAYEWAMKQARR